MTQRVKLELEINQPTEIELLYDEPIIGESQYGSYALYAVYANGSEYAFFAPEDVHAELCDLKKGDKARITKFAVQRGRKVVTKYIVEVSNKIKQHPPAKVVEDIKADEVLESDTGDKHYSVMLQSYRDALKIQQELNGMASPEKIAVTLFIARSKSI